MVQFGTSPLSSPKIDTKHNGNVAPATATTDQSVPGRRFSLQVPYDATKASKDRILPESTKGWGRRGSHDVTQLAERDFLIPIHETLHALLEQEDTDRDYKITIDDTGPKVMALGSATSNSICRYHVQGTYPLSNLLQELSLLRDSEKSSVLLNKESLHENPVTRLSRMIQTEFWRNLTRRIDKANIARVAKDPKDWTEKPRGRLYIPRGTPDQFRYYTKFAQDHPEAELDVILLPEKITADYIRDLNDAPGLLALAVEKSISPETGEETLHGLPFPVPGARFNELYGWDSYFIVLGLLRSGHEDLARSTILNFCFCIEHYGMVFNANRTYYLGRSQPPFLTDMALRTYEAIKHEPGSLELLRTATNCAIKEYYTVWTAHPRLDPITGLSRYRAEGRGVPPETEKSHFVHVLTPYAKKHDLGFEEFIRAYNYGEIIEPALDEYFLHDRSLRESGHDTTYRLEHICADLATYETDIAHIVRVYFSDDFTVPARFTASGAEMVEHSAAWDRRARFRKGQMDKYLWNESKGLYLDYNTNTEQQMPYESVTTLWPLWARSATPHQAALLVQKTLPRFESHGGLAASTEESRGKIGIDRPNRQWDFPCGWAPHQIMAWTGMINYGYHDDAQRLAYKWLSMMTKAFVDFNGVVVEKYDVTRATGPHKVDAEYGNQGADFRGVSREGFGWANSSYLYGLKLMNTHMKRCLGVCAPYELFDRVARG